MTFLPDVPHRPSMPDQSSRPENFSENTSLQQVACKRRRKRTVMSTCEDEDVWSTGHSTNSPRNSLSKDDQILIELKEEQSLTWKRIAEYFPGRSQGSLQVRYCTRLKGRRKAGNSGHSGWSSNARSESACRDTPCEAVEAASGNSKGIEGVSRHRYGPPRHRQTVDRYSPA